MTARREERRRQLAEARFGGICECGDHAWCRLTKGFVALVDAADADTIKTQAFCVALSRRGGVPYAAHGVKGDEGRRRSVLLEHELLGDPPEGKETNFKNGNSLDYHRSNLEWGDHGLIRHRIPRSTKQLVEASGYKGVSHTNRHCITGGRWQANITCGGKQFYLGSFSLTAEGEIAAARAYDAAAQKLFGEFAAVNFPLKISPSPIFACSKPKHENSTAVAGDQRAMACPRGRRVGEGNRSASPNGRPGTDDATFGRPDREGGAGMV